MLRSARFAGIALLLAAFGPARAFAQEDPQANPPIEPPYEPDQRGVVGQQEQPEPPQEQDQQLRSMAPPPSADMAEEVSYGSSSSSSRFGFELALDLGAALSALDSAGDSNLVRASQEGAVGAAVGFRAGVRIGPASVGPRVAMIIDPSFVLANLGISAQIILSPDEVAPFVSLAFGGTIVTNLGGALPAQNQVNIFGIGAEVGGGVRWQPNFPLILGAEVAAGWHHLWREAAACDGACTDGDFDVREHGESDALTLRLSLFAGYAF